MSQTRADLHFKQALVLIEEQLLYISLNVSHAEGSTLPPNMHYSERRYNPQSIRFYSNMFYRQFKIFFNICLFVFISFTLMHTLVIFFLPPTINLISQPSSRSFFLSPPLPVQAEMREGLRRKGEEEELKQDARIKCALTVFDCFCTIFLEWIWSRAGLLPEYLTASSVSLSTIPLIYRSLEEHLLQHLPQI